MKYTVMECHPGYSVLLDEESQLVYAANLNYHVGQKVEHPMLLESDTAEKKSGISVSARKIMAAAACLVLMAGTGLMYYRTNLATYSIIVFSAEGDVSIAVNRRGKVLSVKGNDPAGEALISGYEAKGKDTVTVTRELVQRAVSDGNLKTGDTVSVYVHTPEPAVYDNIQSELEQEAASHPELDLHTNVQFYGQLEEHTPEQTAPRTTFTETRMQERLPAAVPVQTERNTMPEMTQKPMTETMAETTGRSEFTRQTHPQFREDHEENHPQQWSGPNEPQYTKASAQERTSHERFTTEAVKPQNTQISSREQYTKPTAERTPMQTKPEKQTHPQPQTQTQTEKQTQVQTQAQTHPQTQVQTSPQTQAIQTTFRDQDRGKDKDEWIPFTGENPHEGGNAPDHGVADDHINWNPQRDEQDHDDRRHGGEFLPDEQDHDDRRHGGEFLPDEQDD